MFEYNMCNEFKSVWSMFEYNTDKRPTAYVDKMKLFG